MRHLLKLTLGNQELKRKDLCVNAHCSVEKSQLKRQLKCIVLVQSSLSIPTYEIWSPNGY